MTVLTLDRIWINRLDTGEAISAYGEGGRTQEFETGVRVSEYANARVRSLSTGGERGAIPYRLQPVSLATKDLLREWKGVAVQVRDNRGQRWFGTFAVVTVSEYKERIWYSVGFTLQTLTVVEGV